jgi:hypothetical protein
MMEVLDNECLVLVTQSVLVALLLVSWSERPLFAGWFALVLLFVDHFKHKCQCTTLLLPTKRDPFHSTTGDS